MLFIFQKLRKLPGPRHCDGVSLAEIKIVLKHAMRGWMKQFLVILSHLVLAGFRRLPAPTSFGTQSILSSTRTTSSRTFFSTGRARALAITWVWFLNLDSRRSCRTNLSKQNIWLKADMNDYLCFSPLQILPLRRYALKFGFPWTSPSVHYPWYIKENDCSNMTNDI